MLKATGTQSPGASLLGAADWMEKYWGAGYRDGCEGRDGEGPWEVPRQKRGFLRHNGQEKQHPQNRWDSHSALSQRSC